MLEKQLIRWGILGTSPISQVIANAIIASKTSQLVAVGSRSMLTAKKFSTQNSIPKMYDNYHELLNDEEIDAVYIGLPNHLHKEWIIHCANANKNILCEKPFVVSVADAHEVISVLQNSNIFCMEALMYRCHPFIKKLQNIIQNKLIGSIKLYNATYTANIAAIANKTAGGSIRNLGCYPVSLIRHLADAEPIEISGKGRINLQSGTDNQASVILKFADHSIAVVTTADDIEMCWQFDVYGTEGHLKVITNPWLPSADKNIIHLYRDNEKIPEEINVTAEKSLYTYQIDTINQQIIQQDLREFDGISLADSLGNTIVLESWLQQVKTLN